VSVRFYLPESDDLVDLDFDFRADNYSQGRSNAITSDAYAHEVLDETCFDGLLVTKSNITSQREHLIADQGGIRKFLRLPRRMKVMGDCGAFQYISQDTPPYTNEEIFNYYEGLGFDLGITLDHVIVDYDPEYDEGVALFTKEPTDDMVYRQRVSLDNAKAMLKLCKKRKSRFKPIGSVQGWSPGSYHDGVKELIKAGYDYIAIGGVAKAPDKVIVPVLDEIRKTVKRAKVKLHVLGVARFRLLEVYKKTNVFSCDSAATLMQAFKSNKDNYHMPDRNYTAVRIPAVFGDMSPKVRKLLKPLKEAEDDAGFAKEQKRLGKLEKAALRAIRGYAKRRVSLKKAMDALVKYEEQFGGDGRYYPLFEQTLRDRPWEQCPCRICRDIGVEVVIMRGNNRNRRRGFHNTYVFYKRFRGMAGRR
jgi:hypothetical protein